MSLVLPDWPIGISYHEPDEVYHRRQLGVASSHALGEVLRSPAHYRAWLESPDKRTPTLDLGRASHSLILEPDVFDRRYVVVPDFGPQRACQADPETGRVAVTTEEGRANKDRRKAWYAARPEMAEDYIGPDKPRQIEEEDRDRILGIRDALTSNSDALDLLCDGRAEVTLRWRCPETGLPCKARIDWWADDVDTIADLKTCDDARDAERAIRTYGYRRQDAHYLDGLRELGRPGRFVFIFVERERPHGVRILELDDDARAHGRAQIDKAKRNLADCMATNVWPSYSRGVEFAGLERWERE